MAWQKFSKKVKQGIPDVYNMFEEYTKLPIIKSQDISNAISIKTRIKSFIPKFKCR